MKPHNVTIVDFHGKKTKKKPVGKIVLFSLLALVVLLVSGILAVFFLLPSLTSDKINRYVEPPSTATFEQILGQVPEEEITWEMEAPLIQELKAASYQGVGLWGYNRLVRAEDHVTHLGMLKSSAVSPALDTPEIWDWIEFISYKGRVYLIKYFPSFYGPPNVSCFEAIGDWEQIQMSNPME